MSRRDQVLPAAAFVALASMGLLMLVLLTNAQENGRRALENALLSEVQAIAATQNAQVGAQFTAGEVLGNDPWELRVGSDADRARLREFDELLGAALNTGFFVTDAAGTVTAGVNLTSEDLIGQPLERPGMQEFLAAVPNLPGSLLPMAPGITTELPTVALVLLLNDESGPPYGAFVLEIEIAPGGQLNTEFADFRRGDTGSLYVIGPSGAVLAGNEPSALGQPLRPELVGAPTGVSSVDGAVVATADVPLAGWRVLLTQDRDEFEEGLTGPLQRVGTIIVVVFVAVGVVSFVALSRRLRAAREEQERLRQLTENQEEFISIVSHELRTPVAGVLGFLQTTIDHWDSMTDSERSGAVLRAASNARRLQGLTRDVLDSQSVESGRMTYAMAPADLREEVEVAVDAARALYPAQRFDVEFDVEQAPVRMDVDRIQQVLTNLIDNAVRVSPPEQPIEFRLGSDDGRVRVSVQDHGPGLPPDMEERIFEKFVRGRTGTVTGTGLGLYIARQILEAHGGSITVVSTPGDGAEFTVDLPLLESAVAL